ncbi:MAG TPA: circadian clock KaiB family protein [Vicinamibacterales bacterium]|nr:circadian clock KaiB family protein [Vicinamibacterales bacterium]
MAGPHVTGATRAARTEKSARYVLRLYVAGLTRRSAAAIESVKRVCEDHLKDRYDLQIVDTYREPTLARGGQIIAAPTLIKKLPPPVRRLIGDMADRKRVLVGLDLREQGSPDEEGATRK